MEMKRLGIFVFYDAYGVADRYISVLLEGLLLHIDKLIIVVNGELTKDSEQLLKTYAHHLFRRKNIGYDGGAYKDVFLTLLADEDWDRWDEIVLFNDTFFAPIFPWKPVFDKMADQNVDFWGLTKHPQGYVSYLEKEIPEHLQGYFLVCRKGMIKSKEFWEFWKNLSYPKTFGEAVENFEFHFTTYFKRGGFRYKAYMDFGDQSVVGGTTKEPIPYVSRMYELLKEMHLPIIKVKALLLSNFIQAHKALNFVAEHSDYDMNLIFEHHNRLLKEHRIRHLFELEEIEEFYYKHQRVFFYGHGLVGKNISAYFQERGWKYNGFLVSKKESIEKASDKNVFLYCDMNFEPTDGIIVTLGEETFLEVYPTLKNEIPADQLLLPQHEWIFKR